MCILCKISKNNLMLSYVIPAFCTIYNPLIMLSVPPTSFLKRIFSFFKNDLSSVITKILMTILHIAPPIQNLFRVFHRKLVGKYFSFFNTLEDVSHRIWSNLRPRLLWKIFFFVLSFTRVGVCSKIRKL